MIREEYVSFETAKLLREKGFDELCIMKYNSEGRLVLAGAKIQEWQNSELDDDEYIACTQQMAMRWLREVHRIHIQAFCPLVDVDCGTEGIKYNVVISNLANMCLAFDTPLEDIEYDSYEEACEAACLFVLNNLI